MLKVEKDAAKTIRELLEKNLGSTGPAFQILRIEDARVFAANRIDFVARLRAPTGQEAVLLIESKSRGEPSILSQAITQLKAINVEKVRSEVKVGKNWVGLLIVAPYVSERGRELCIQNNVGYMDYAGNCYFSLGAFTIDRTGRENPSHDQRIARSLFAPKAARVSRAILEEPIKDWTLLDLSKATGLSVGYVHAVVKKLEAQGFVTRTAHKRVKLEKPADLLESWTKDYAVTDNEMRGYYTFERGPRAFSEKLAAAVRRTKIEYALTVHAGADFVAPFTRFAVTHLYVRAQDVEKLVKGLDLRPADTGPNVVVLIPKDDGVFYRKQEIGGVSVVCNTQLYVDLRNYAARGEEAAQALRENKLKF